MKLFLTLAALALVGAAYGRHHFRHYQQVGVEGRVVCPSNPQAIRKVFVELADDDSLQSRKHDDVLQKSRVQPDGSFHLHGGIKSLGHIDPLLKIYHDCDNQGQLCPRYWELKIPKHYVGSTRAYPFGTIDLSKRLSSESFACEQNAG